MKKYIKIIILIFFVTKINAEEISFDFAFNLANIGWGMDIGNNNYHQINLNFSNLFIENINSGIGIELSPFNSWSDIDSGNLMSFLNIGFHYNLIYGKFGYEYERKGSNYSFAGPFVSLNYIQLGNYSEYSEFSFNNFQINSGIKLLAMIDVNELYETEGGFPIGFQICNIELGYRFRNNNEHRFYFNINIDIIYLVYIIGLFVDKS